MTSREYLWCALHLILDDEEEADLLCPACRAQAEQQCCPVCGGEAAAWQEGENAAFDLARFLQLKEGEKND